MTITSHPTDQRSSKALSTRSGVWPTKAIMLIAGLITASTAYAFFFPEAGLDSIFGESLSDGALGEIIVRSWGSLVALVGAILVYGAFSPKNRPLILTVAGISKLIFVGLLLTLGTEFWPKIAPFVVLDSIAFILFAIILIDMRSLARAGAHSS